MLLWKRGDTIHICKLCLYIEPVKTPNDLAPISYIRCSNVLVYAYLMTFVLYVFMFMCTFIYIHYVAGILCAVLASQNWYWDKQLIVISFILVHIKRLQSLRGVKNNIRYNTYIERSHYRATRLRRWLESRSYLYHYYKQNKSNVMYTARDGILTQPECIAL